MCVCVRNPLQNLLNNCEEKSWDHWNSWVEQSIPIYKYMVIDYVLALYTLCLYNYLQNVHLNWNLKLQN